MGNPVAVYPYTDSEGRCLRKLRYEPKSFSWEHETEAGWRPGNGGRRPTLYRLAEIVSADPSEPVFICEGEKDVDRLWNLGLLATCNPDGASKGESKWRPEFSEALTDRLVAIIPDFDEAGWVHALTVRASLAGKARAAVILPLSELEEHGDVSDWLHLGHTAEELRAEAATVLGWELEKQLFNRDLRPASAEGGSVVTMSRFAGERRDDVPTILGDGVIAKESLNVLAGDPGTGKTLLALNLSICLAARRPFLGLSVPELCPILFLEAEGNRDRFRERVLTAQGSLGLFERRLPIFFAPRGASFEIGEELERMIDTCGPWLVVLDTIGLFHQGEENSSTDWRKFVVKPLRRLIDTTGTAFLLLHHFGKPSESRSGGHRVRGTSAIKGDSDSLLLLENAKTGGELRVLTFDKIKNGPPLDPIVIRFAGERAVFELTSDDAVTAMKPRLAEVQRIVGERGEVTTAQLKAAIMDELEMGRSQAEGLISSAHAAGLIEKRRRGVYGPVGGLLALHVADGVPITADGNGVPF